MATSISYEVYAKMASDSDWRIVSVHESKSIAVNAARGVLKQPNAARVQVVAEHFDASTNKAVGTTILEATSADAIDAVPKKSKSASSPIEVRKPKAPKPVTRKRSSFFGPLAVTVLILSVVGLGVVMAFATMID